MVWVGSNEVKTVVEVWVGSNEVLTVVVIKVAEGDFSLFVRNFVHCPRCVCESDNERPTGCNLKEGNSLTKGFYPGSGGT